MHDTSLTKIQKAVEVGSQDLVQRRIVFELVVLGVLAQEHVLMIGPPGTGKSAAVRKVASHFSGTHFEYLLGRFTEPAELFGAMSIDALRDGRVEVVTDGMLPEANIAFLDEIFLGSTAILNTLLGLLNERVYRRGAQCIDVPLWTCVAASNGMPDDPMLAAFADRFLLTTFVEPVGMDNVAALLRAGWSQGRGASTQDPALQLTADEVDALVTRTLEVDLDQVIDPYVHVINKLSVRGLSFSDRRLVRGQKLIAAAAVLSGRDTATVADLWPVVYMIQDLSLQEEAKELLAEELQMAENVVLDQSAKAAAYGPAAYAADLVQMVQKHLDAKPQMPDDQTQDRWLLRAEGLVARIDAGFSDDTRPEALSLARSALVAAIR